MNTIATEHRAVANAAINDYLKYVNDDDNPIPGDIYHRMNNALTQYEEGRDYAATNSSYCLGYVHAARSMNARKPAIEAAYRAAEIVNRIIQFGSMYEGRAIDERLPD